MFKLSDRNIEYMKQTWGTTKLVTDYGVLEETKMLREINNDTLTPKKHDFIVQNEIHEKIRNQKDYDDWEYGTEPIPLQEW
jgi:phosphopantothenoylcysteine synthetase/decarboxylase